MALHLPAGVDRERLLAPVRVPDETWNDPAWRRWVTRKSPFYFALVYCGRFLDPLNTGDQSFSRLHFDFALAAKRWKDRYPGQVIRDFWVSPRESAKTTWLFQINPLWALAHKHLSYVLALGDNAERAGEHLDEVRHLIEQTPALLADYPHLRPGRKDSAGLLITKGEQAFRAQGWGGAALGNKVNGQRPQLIIIDDLEPGAEAYTLAAREQRLLALQRTILPMSQNAIVQINQSVPAHGSLAHDVVCAVHGIGEIADWITAGQWTCRHYPAIVVDADGNEQSLWERRGRNPGGWTLAWLRRERELSPASYALNYDGRALPPATNRSWRRDLFTPAAAHWRVAQRVLAVDGAVSNKASSDPTGFAVVAQARGVHPIETVAEYARGFRLTPDERRGKVIELLAVSPDIGVVVVEQNQGGDLWLHLLKDLHTDRRWPAGRAPVKVELVPAGKGSKQYRQAQHLYRWEQGKIRPVGPLPEFEAQAERYPHVDHDDVLDAVDLGDRWLTKNRV